MLNKPKFMAPSTNMQECVIDAGADEILFSCIVDGNEAISAWQIKIYTLNDSAIVLDTGKQTLSSPFFPIDSKNKNVVFERDVKPYIKDSNNAEYYPANSTYDKGKTYYKRSGSEGSYTYTEYTYDEKTWSKDYKSLYYKGIFKNSTSLFYWTISFWSNGDIEKSTPTTTSCEEVFHANTSPVLTIKYNTNKNAAFNDYVVMDNEQVTIDTKHCSFMALYEQSENVSLKKYGWRIIDVNSGATLIDTITSNQIYGTKDNIACYYDGFLNEGSYTIELLIETQNNSSVITPPILFFVAYGTTFINSNFEVMPVHRESCVCVKWGYPSTLLGVMHDDSNNGTDYYNDYPVKNHMSLHLNPESSLVYSNENMYGFDIPEEAYMILSTNLWAYLPKITIAYYTNTKTYMASFSETIFSADGEDSEGNTIKRTLNICYEYYRDDKHPDTNRETLYLRYECSQNNMIINSARYTFNESIVSIVRTTDMDIWCVITLAPPGSSQDKLLNVVAYTATGDGGLSPSNSTYPRDDLYPSAHSWVQSN